MSIREIFKQNLKYYRKQKGFTQESLSEKIGLNPKYITNIESQSKFPSAETIDEIAKALEIPSFYLFMEDGCPDSFIKFNKHTFTETLIKGISAELKPELLKYLDKHL